MLIITIGLVACKSEQPEIMKAVKQFESDEIRDKHAAHMRRNHMDELLHKRDLTVIKGIRTKKHSLKECINCHVPEKHNGEVLRHTNPEHFCSSCHGYVAQALDCFQCHADHPASNSNTTRSHDDNIHNSSLTLNSSNPETLAVNSNSTQKKDAQSEVKATNVSSKKESASE